MKNTENSIDKAIPRDSDDADFYFRRAIAKDSLGRYVEAISDYNETIRIDPNNPDAYYFRGLAKNFLGQAGEARQNFQKALSLSEIMGDETLKDLIMKEL